MSAAVRPWVLPQGWASAAQHRQTVLEFIVWYKFATDGNTPTLRAIGAAVLMSTTAVHAILGQLEQAGKIRRRMVGLRSMEIDIPGGAWLPPVGFEYLFGERETECQSVRPF